MTPDVYWLSGVFFMYACEHTSNKNINCLTDNLHHGKNVEMVWPE